MYIYICISHLPLWRGQSTPVPPFPWMDDPISKLVKMSEAAEEKSHNTPSL